jgi:hypothetical protein
MLKYHFGVFYDMETFQILFLCDYEYRDLGEMVVSILASSYIEHGGVNAKMAVGTPSVFKPSERAVFDEEFEKNREFLLVSGCGIAHKPTGRGNAFVRAAENVKYHLQLVQNSIDDLNSRRIGAIHKMARANIEELGERFVEIR